MLRTKDEREVVGPIPGGAQVAKGWPTFNKANKELQKTKDRPKRRSP